MRTIPNLLTDFHVLLDVNGNRETSANYDIDLGNGVIYYSKDTLISISPVVMSNLVESSYDIILAVKAGEWTVVQPSGLIGKNFTVRYYWESTGASMIVSAGRIVAANTMFKTDVLGERLLKLTGGSPTYKLDDKKPIRISSATPLATGDTSFERMQDNFKKMTFKWGHL